MQIDCSFSLTDLAISAMHNQSKHMLNNASGVENTKTNVADAKDAESYMDDEAGAGSSGPLIKLGNLPVRMTNPNIAAQTYGANIGLLDRYRQWTQTKLELLG
jgi:hypothetical protein